MGPKYIAGNKVRIKSQDLIGRVLDANISQYENMTGEIIESTNIVAFIVEPWAKPGGTGERVTVYYYTVKIDEETTLNDVLEDCLEIIQ
jgi:hypothetical protein